MRILYVALKHDYGRPEQGLSYEHFNFYDPLARMGNEILYFDFMTLMDRHGREGMNRRLLEVARSERPDLMFTVLFGDELDPDTVQRISRGTDTTTLNWFCDDQWRFETFSSRWAPRFNWVVTTSATAVPRYEAIGVPHVLRSQWACNHFLYRPLDLPLRHDVTFIGQPHGDRREIVAALRGAGLRVEVWGQGWESGRLSQERMIEVFNQSRVNLNLSNTSAAPGALPPRGPALAARRIVSKALAAAPGGDRIKAAGKRLAASLRSAGGVLPASDRGAGAGADSAEAGAAPVGQIKGRNFEVPGCGAFLLTEPAEDLDLYYEDGREVVRFESLADLVEKARRFIADDEQRAAIARAGRERTLREHTWVHRFSAIFGAIGLPAPDPAAFLEDGAGREQEVVEIS